MNQEKKQQIEQRKTANQECTVYVLQYSSEIKMKSKQNKRKEKK